MAALLAAAVLPGPGINVPASHTTGRTLAAEAATSKALPAARRAGATQAERKLGIPLVFSSAPTPPWINKHGYLLRSLRRNVHRGGSRA